MSNQFISARPDSNHDVHSSDSYTVGTSLHLRASRERQENLAAYADYFIDSENLKVNLDPTAETASIQNFSNNNSPTLITIPTFEQENIEIENPFPDIDDEEFYAMLQYAEIIHEGGHHEHTDQPSVQKHFQELDSELSELPRGLQQFAGKLCKDLWNAIEDGAMEEAIRNERGPRVAQRLAIKNETFIAQSVKRYPEETRKNVTFDLALHIAAMDLSKYDTGALRRLFDDNDPSWQFASEHHKEVFLDLYPEIRHTIEDAFTIPNPASRTTRIFDFLSLLIETLQDKVEEEIDNTETAEQEREQLQDGQQDDTENQSGPAQTQQSQGLQQNSRQEIAQQHANVSQQTVTTDSDSNEQSGESEQSDQEQSSTENQNGETDTQQTNEDTDDVGDGESGQTDSQTQQSDTPNDNEKSTGSENAQAGSEPSEEADTVCPSCGATNTTRLVQQVDGMIAARVNAPFDITADWVDSITFISNDDLCGFRVETDGTVPRDSIEENGYKVVDVSNAIEILEPRDRYNDTEPVRGFECESCSYTWVPTIGGDPE